MDTLPVWKRIYPVIASTNPNVTNDIVDNVLDICKGNISDIFLQYENYSKEGFLKWKKNLGVNEIVSDDEMCNFIHILSKKLNLDANVVWIVICNFLMYEYYGKVDELKTLIKFNSKIEYLTENIWYFYTADRMFLLKTLRHILDSVEDKKGIYYKKFCSFIKNMDFAILWKNAVKVFDNLIHEIGKDTIHLVPRDLLNEWIHRNNREQLEVLLLLLQILQDLKLSGSELENTLSLFIRHGFTRHPLYAESIKISKQEDLCQIKNAEISVILVILNKYWESPDLAKQLPTNLERNLELLQVQGNNSIVMFAWLIFKLSRKLFGTKLDDELEICDFMVKELLKKNVFESIYILITHRMFTSFNSRTVVTSIYTLLVEFLKVYKDFSYFCQQQGAVQLVAKLIELRGVIILEKLGPVFQFSMEAFPYVYEPFLMLCKSLLSIPERYEFTMGLLKSLPTFLTEIPYSHRHKKYTATEHLQLFMDSNLFVIPKGTVVEKFLYNGREFSKFHFSFSFFLLMEQFTKSLSTISFEAGTGCHYYKNLSDLVHNGFQCIHHILKHYKGNYRQDVELRTLVQRLDIVPTQFCEGPMKNSDFILLYFSINCTLIKKELLDYMEAFLPVLRKRFMPFVTSYSKETKNNLYSQLDDKSLLYKALKEEGDTENHKLLIEYLELIYFMVEINRYHHDIQLPGIWYIITNVFPLHQQWKYKEFYEKTKITKLCISIFVSVLKRHLLKLEAESARIFEMVIESFYHEEITISSYMSVFSKENFYLQNLMESEINWTSGPALECLESLRLQLVLLLLLFKHKKKVGGTKNVLDNNVGFFAKGVTPYIINPYSLALRKLSCRFLEILSRDQNVPLMALLGLDYDQVQRLYLDRLRDSTEDDDLKLHVLDLIGTCVVYQHGMTAAFFNVKRSRKWYCDNKEKTIESDTVSDFMIDYLQNIKKSPIFLKSPLQIGILHIMVNLWSSGKKHLIDEVINLDQFWPLLSNPLYREFDQLPKVYAYIFRIYSIQLLEPQNDKKFLFSVEKFVSDKKQVKNWIEFLRLCFKDNSTNVEDIEDKQFLLRSWMEFIIMLEKTKEIKEFDEVNKLEFIMMTLDGLAFPLVNTNCLNPWMDLILLQLSYWKIPSKGDLKVLSEKSVNALNIIKLYYNDLKHSARLAVLTVIQELLENLHDYFQSSSLILMNFLQHFGFMFDFEYDLINEKQWKTANETFDTAVREYFLPWMMCVRIVSGLFEFNNLKDINCWFTYRNVIEKFMSCSCELIQHSPTMSLAKIVLHSLTLYADSTLYLDFLNIHMNDFFVKVAPPLTAILLGHNKANPMQLEEGWITCSVLIQFLTAYFKSLQYEKLPDCYVFVMLAEHILRHIFNILDTTVALKALDMVINTLILFNSILENWRLEWYRKSNNSYNFIINGVKKIVNACLYAILRPKNIIVYTLDESNRLTQLEKSPVELMVAIVNRLVTAVGLGFSILYRINPGLTNLLDQYLPDTVISIIDNDFSVPKFELPISNKLTYGMLLCLAHFLCKTIDVLKLNKNQTSSTVPSEYFTRVFGMVEHQDFSDNTPTQKLSAFLRYAMYEYSGLADPWIQKLNYNRVQNSLEHLMLFLSQQIFLDTRKASIENASYFKRNLSSELQFFYEHVKKITSLQLTNSPNSLSPSCRLETDILKKYLLHHKETKQYEKIVDTNFCIIISYWFTNICKLK